MEIQATSKSQDSVYWSEFRRGVITIAPLWAGAVPFGIAIGISAVAAGFSGFESFALSALVFAGAAQIAVVSLFSGGAGLLAITLTTLMVNLRHVLYGMSLDRQLDAKPRPGRAILAFLMIDETYGVATRDHMDGRGGHAFFFGASLSVYLVYCLSTLAGVLLGSVLPDPESIGIDFIFPLMFVALVVPLLRSRKLVIVAGVAGLLALGLGTFTGGGTTVLITTILAASLGAWLERD